MILMINGAFGAGKTTVATELTAVIANSMIYDPEEVGYMLRNIITEDIKHPAEKTGDFQDLELWKILVVQVAESLQTTYQKNLIVPMTIYNKDYFQYIFGGFKEIDDQTHHFCLVAEEETIYNRLRARGEVEGNWCFQQTKKCVEAFQDECFEDRIVTDEMSVKEIVENIVGKIYVK
ncbi:AAA family ATPase [Fredinandcohnia sp. 179-A 10B2 NHS]|uniref:AAA family ATPase n=1 Tax=Fredinandcohnia sp. 179-A 10B2 NHS TaxID=3235176 RepID=UPI00399FB387